MTMMPRLQAEEQLIGVRMAGLGAGLYPPAEALEILRTLRNRSTDHVERARKAAPADLAAMGIGMVSAPAEKAVNDG
jgi:hypothetical protein